MSDANETQPLDEHSVAKILIAIGALDVKVTAQVTALDAKVTALQGDVAVIQDEMDSLRAFQIDQERERHSFLLSAAAAGRGGLPSSGSNLTTSGARFKRTRSDLKPASIY